MNLFRILGDLSHITSKCILIFAIHQNRSSEGVSMITQALYAAVFCTRYTNLFSETSTWNVFFMIFYIFSSFYIIAIMRYKYPRTREREVAWKLGGAAAAGALVLSPFTTLIFRGPPMAGFLKWLWNFSEILESVAVLPQLLLLRQTTVPTVINSGYILTLGSYRALYIPNWIWRYAHNDPPYPVSVIFGVIQTAFYIDFAWVYYTRQRVKLRNGGIVDADDMRRGWLLDRIFGIKRFDPVHDDEESAPALGSGNGNGASNGARRSKWGARGISVSADEDTHEHEASRGNEEFSADPDAKMQDPDELARALDDDDDDEHTPATSSASSRGAAGAANEVSNGSEWRD
ncbi:hypothetical protein PFICI_13312 [Pestalotiopsis fici W106-1]|uniref:ER lumen protein-retaining receptor n=1 Tax=Pestalotiopsis fici (strain W106-1 / CGMCC3.15140) TaxID=1229662 RepID=W3WLT9_PESFW|nr:uncharacterized protein PFICI_13312 [Pestalotiopsis fici W106-1]ETS74828.1 hypothetical protein PFICI_13312 [Pestalotiopsis fici W106-1]